MRRLLADRDFRQRVLPVVVWSACALVALGMLVGRARRFEYVGLAQSLEYEVSPTTTGTLDAVLVDVYDAVDSGQIVAQLDGSAVEAMIATSQATIGKLRADLDAARAGLTVGGLEGAANWRENLRRFQVDESQRRLDRLALRVEIEGDRVELERLDVEARRAERLWQEGILPQSDFDNARLAREQVRKRLDENEVLLAQTEREWGVAEERRSRYESGLPSGPEEVRLRPLHEAVEVEARRLEEIQVLRRSLVLRSPVRGRVTQIVCRRGQSVVPGEPVLYVAEEGASEIVAYLREDDPRPVEPDSGVVIVPRRAGSTISESVVVRVSPTIQPLPQRLWRDPRFPDYGRAVVISASPSMRLVPGEIVDVRFRGRRS